MTQTLYMTIYLLLIKLRNGVSRGWRQRCRNIISTICNTIFEGCEASDCKSYWAVWTVECFLRVSVNVLFFFTLWRFGLLIYIFTAALWLSVALENVWGHYQWQTRLLMPHLMTSEERSYPSMAHGPYAFCADTQTSGSTLTKRRWDCLHLVS